MQVPLIDDDLAKAVGGPTLNMMDIARQTPGPMFVLRHLGEDRVVAHGVDLVTELSDDTRFSKHLFPTLVEMRHIAGDGLFTAHNDEPNWQLAHDILLPAFGRGALNGYHSTMMTMARRLIDRWDKHLDGRPVDVLADMTRLAMDTIGHTGFGYEFDSFERAELHPIVTTLLRAMLQARARDSRVPGQEHLYRQEDEQFAADVSFLIAQVDDVIRARKGSGDARTDDLLGLMLNARHPESGQQLADANIRNQVITFLIAGHETTASLLSFALYYVVNDPDVLARAQAEVDALWGCQHDPDPTFEDVGRLRYVRQILNESLRLWPIAPMFSRAAREDTVLGGVLPLKAGQPVRVLVPMLHRDPVWGDNRHKFDPDRFSPQRSKDRPVHAYKPFGTGVRACLGRQFSLHEATLVLGLLLHRYEFSSYANYQLAVQQVLTFKPRDFRLMLTRRTANAPDCDLAKKRVPQQLPRVASQVRQGTALTVLHGSNLGTCRSLARRVADEGTGYGFTATTSSLDDYAAGLPADGPVVIVAASYNGRPTDDAIQFMVWLEKAASNRDRTPAGVRFAVLGVGDSNWADTFQRVPTLIDAKLAQIGATRLVARGEADAAEDLAGSVDRWTAELWAELLRQYGDPDRVDVVDTASDESPYEVRLLPAGTTAALDARYDAVTMTVLDNSELVATDRPFGRSKRHLRIALPPGATYRTGDHLLVLPDNPPALVERAAELTQLSLDQIIDLRPRPGSRSVPLIDRPVTVRQLLTHFVELQDLLVVDPSHRLSLDVLLKLLPARLPRYYSISSSALVEPDCIELMVSVRSGGVCSTYLSGLRAGDLLRAQVHPCREAFRATRDLSVPIIMVGAGTGLAPFRGFIADRKRHLAGHRTMAPALCYFGCDHPDVDYLHRDELQAAHQAGAVSMRPTYSRAPECGARFVQHRILAEASEVWQLLHAGGRVYVCGDGALMAPAVRAAFRQVYRDHSAGSEQHAKQWLSGLMTEGRYVEDVFAS
jgi:cytochrome P450 / NADPH-cytochrome P450 reductase